MKKRKSVNLGRISSDPENKDFILNKMNEAMFKMDVGQNERSNINRVRYMLVLRDYALFKRSKLGRPPARKLRRIPRGPFFEGLTWKNIPVLFSPKAERSTLERTEPVSLLSGIAVGIDQPDGTLLIELLKVN